MFRFDYSPEFQQWLVMPKNHTTTVTDLHLGRLCLENHVLSQTLTIGPVLLLNLLETDRNALPLTTFK